MKLQQWQNTFVSTNSQNGRKYLLAFQNPFGFGLYPRSLAKVTFISKAGKRTSHNLKPKGLLASRCFS